TPRSPLFPYTTLFRSTRCSERNVRASPWFSIRGTIRRTTLRISTDPPTISLVLWSPPKPGDSVVVLGTGGVSIFALQFARFQSRSEEHTSELQSRSDL